MVTITLTPAALAALSNLIDANDDPAALADAGIDPNAIDEIRASIAAA